MQDSRGTEIREFFKSSLWGATFFSNLCWYTDYFNIQIRDMFHSTVQRGIMTPTV